ncbi:hypothetical protein SALBM311S_06526 [Streptomyces alboniger]
MASSPTEPASTPRRARLARVASRVRNESVICAGRCSASAVTSAPQRSPTTTTVPDSGTFSSARCRSRYSSDASQARSLSRGSSGKRDSSNSPQCVFIRSFIVGKASRAAAQGVSGRMETMDAGLFPRPRTQIAPGAVHVPEWLDPVRQRELVAACLEWARPPAGLRTVRTPGGGTMTARQVCLGWHWYPYAYARTVVDGDQAPVKPFPELAGELGRRAVTDALGSEEAASAAYDIALINFYDGDARMGMHRDSDEKSRAPVVSLSLGDTCVFRFGNTQTRAEPAPRG